MDFFTVPTLTDRVLFVLVVLSHRDSLNPLSPCIPPDATAESRHREYVALALHVPGGPDMIRHAARLAVAGGALVALYIVIAGRSQLLAVQTPAGRGAAVAPTARAPKPTAPATVDVTATEATSLTAS